jgi:hypothetical protein
MTIEIDTYGLMIEHRYFYISLTWAFILTMSVVGATIRLYQQHKRKGKK